jgi:RNA polymerase sigma factor (sigma-70 family)
LNTKDNHKRIEEISKTIYSFSISRTSNQQDAEDLSQDILLEIIKCTPKLRNEAAFYGFMWAIANNVYKQWLSKRAKKAMECELTEDISESDDKLEALLEDNNDLILLCREMSLLKDRYRRAMILYYYENKSCTDISKLMQISESMVKQLLFKARKILKEGMNMERKFGEQSYNPKTLWISYWGEGSPDKFFAINNNKIQQNILIACYNDNLTGEELSLQIGIPLPYLQDEIKGLENLNLLMKNGTRYATNLVIYTRELKTEVIQKTLPYKNKLAQIIADGISEHEEDIRNIGFYGCDMNTNIFRWQITSLLMKFFAGDLDDIYNLDYPTTVFGRNAFVWGNEFYDHTGQEDISDYYNFIRIHRLNDIGDYLNFFDFWVTGISVNDLFSKQPVANVFIDIAKGKRDNFSENDKMIIAELLKRGLIKQSEHGYSVNVPVFTEKQMNNLQLILKDLRKEINNIANEIYNVLVEVLSNHVPVHLKEYAKKVVPLRLLSEVISSTIGNLCQQKYLTIGDFMGEFPSIYIVLKD